MKILFIGGTGLISNACARVGAGRGMDITILNRSRTDRFPTPEGTSFIQADAFDEKRMAEIVQEGNFDVVVDWIAFNEADIQRDLRLFQGKIGQFVFISSASAYQKPPKSIVIKESTPLENPFWQYSRDKIACENALMAAYEKDGFPVTIIRPSLTYGEGQLPLVLNSWQHPFTIVDRIRRKKPIVVPGDGSSLWVMTYNEDFATGFLPLMGNSKAIGESFHITSDEALSWDHIFGQFVAATGMEADLVHVPVANIVSLFPEFEGTLTGDKTNSAVFDNTKIRSIAPEFECKVPWREGVRRSYEWLLTRPQNQTVDADLNAKLDTILTNTTTR